MSTSLNPCLPLVRLSECGGSHFHAFHSSAPDFSELRVYYRTSMGLVNLEFHFGRVLMRFVEVACVSTSLTPCFAHVPHSQACHSGAADFPELRVYSRTPLGLVKLRFHFSRVLMRFVEVACVRTSLNPCLPLVRLSECGGSHSHACHSGAPYFSELRVYSRAPMGPHESSEAGIPLWRRSPAFGGSGRREYKPQALVSRMCLTLTHAIPALLIFRSCTSIPELP